MNSIDKLINLAGGIFLLVLPILISISPSFRKKLENWIVKYYKIFGVKVKYPSKSPTWARLLIFFSVIFALILGIYMVWTATSS